MLELLYVHHIMAKLVKTYPSIPSMGSTIPIKLVITSGNKQYPSTERLLGKVKVLERCEVEEADEG